MKSKYSLVLVTVPDEKTASKITDTMLKQKLASCVNAVDNIKSSYWWEDKIEHSGEILLMIKTTTALIPELVSFVKDKHPYDTPEIISLDITGGFNRYLDWIGSVCRTKANAKIPKIPQITKKSLGK